MISDVQWLRSNLVVKGGDGQNEVHSSIRAIIGNSAAAAAAAARVVVVLEGTIGPSRLHVVFASTW
jgi:hypothetical protein